MTRTILVFGAIAGLLVAVPMSLMVANSEPGSAAHFPFRRLPGHGARPQPDLLRRQATARP